MMKRIVSVGVIILIIAIGFLQKEELLQIIKSGGLLSSIISMLLVAICGFFPVVPFAVLGGLIGAVFGTAHGVIVSLTGAMMGTMAFFFLSRYGFRDLAQEKLAKYPKLQEYEKFLERNSFAAILTSRLIPVIPAMVVNLVCGLSRVNWLIFFTASIIGKIPNVLLVSYVGASFSRNRLLSFGIYGSYILLIFLINLVIYFRTRSKTIK